MRFRGCLEFSVRYSKISAISLEETAATGMTLEPSAW